MPSWGIEGAVIPYVLLMVVIKSGRHKRLFSPQQTRGRSVASLMSLLFSMNDLELLDLLPPSPQNIGIMGVISMPVYAVLGVELRASCILTNHSA